MLTCGLQLEQDVVHCAVGVGADEDAPATGDQGPHRLHNHAGLPRARHANDESVVSRPQHSTAGDHTGVQSSSLNREAREVSSDGTHCTLQQAASRVMLRLVLLSHVMAESNSQGFSNYLQPGQDRAE